jgi:hypothetical protein
MPASGLHGFAAGSSAAESASICYASSYYVRSS